MIEFILRQYVELPPFTKYFATACILLSFAVNLDFLTVYDVYFSPNLIFNKFQIWRLITPFLYLGPFSFNFLLTLVFSFQYCNFMELTTFHSRKLDFAVFFIYGWIIVLLYGYFATTLYLNDPFMFMMIYVWARINPHVNVNFMGIIIPANFVPGVILGFTIIFSNSCQVEVIGFVTGHIYYYFEFVYPALPASNGFKLFQPWIWIPKIINYFRAERNPVPVTSTTPTSQTQINKNSSQAIPSPSTGAASIVSSESNAELYDSWSLPLINDNGQVDHDNGDLNKSTVTPLHREPEDTYPDSLASFKKFALHNDDSAISAVAEGVQNEVVDAEDNTENPVRNNTQTQPVTSTDKKED